MAAAAAEQRHASAGLAQDPSSLQPPDLLRTMAADGGLDDIPDPTAMTDSQRARMAEELIQRTLAEPSPDDPVFTGGELDEVLASATTATKFDTVWTKVANMISSSEAFLGLISVKQMEQQNTSLDLPCRGARSAP